MIFASFFIILIIHIPTHCVFVLKLIINIPSYLYYTGAYAQTMVIHAFCNIDDVSWGTKGSSSNNGGKKYEADKVFFVSSWLFYNACLAFIFLYVDIITVENGFNTQGGYILIVIALFGTFIITYKSIFAFYYQMKWLCFERCCAKIKSETGRAEGIDRFWAKEFR